MTCEFPGCTGIVSHLIPHPVYPDRGYLGICWGHQEYGIYRIEGWPDVQNDDRHRRAISLEGRSWQGCQLRAAREMRGKEREEIAPILEISELEMWQIEQGKRPLTSDLVARLMTRVNLDILVEFLERPELPNLGFSTLWFHTPVEELCESCAAGIAVAFCDYPRCDRRLCDDCRMRPDATTEYCPSHKVWAV